MFSRSLLRRLSSTHVSLLLSTGLPALFSRPALCCRALSLNVPGQLRPREVAQLRKENKALLVDVREKDELMLASIKGGDVVHCPVNGLLHAAQNEGDVPSEISNQLLSDRGKHVVVFCHHGVRSLMGAGALMRLGVENVSSMIGGIAQWAEEVDPSVGRY